jgi:hypothetical protein
MRSYQHALNEEQMADLMELAGWTYETKDNDYTGHTEVAVYTDDKTFYFRDHVTMGTPIIPHIFQFFIKTKNGDDPRELY